MKNTTERRMLILQKLCECRRDCIRNLAEEFHVSYNTVRSDIQVLSCSYPIYTSQGAGGGVAIMDGYRLGMKYLTLEQAALLEKLSEQLTGEELLIMQRILKTFSKSLKQFG